MFVKQKNSFNETLHVELLSLQWCIFHGSFVASLSTSLRGVDANKYCNWCHHINCVPSKMWSCNDKEVLCEVFGYNSVGRKAIYDC